MKAKGIMVLITALVFFLAWSVTPTQAEKDQQKGGKAQGGGGKGGQTHQGGGGGSGRHGDGGGGPGGGGGGGHLGGGGGQQGHQQGNMPGQNIGKGQEPSGIGRHGPGSGQLDQRSNIQKQRDAMKSGKSAGLDKTKIGKGQLGDAKSTKKVGPDSIKKPGMGGPDKPGIKHKQIAKPDIKKPGGPEKDASSKQQKGALKAPPDKAKLQASVSSKGQNPELKAKMHAKVDPAKHMEARKHFQAEHSRFNHQYNSRFRLMSHHSRMMRSCFSRLHYSYSSWHYSWHYRWTTFYGSYGYVAPAYVCWGFYPYYGLWDTYFLDFALAHVVLTPYLAFYYNHWLDPDVVAWMRAVDQLNAQAAESEQDRQAILELQVQMAALKQKVADMEALGMARDENYIPEEAEDIAFSYEAIEAYNQAQQAKAPNKM